VDRVHVDRDPRGLSVGAVQQLDARDAFVPQFRHAHLAVIAGQNLEEIAPLLLPHHDGGQESIPLDRVLERRHLPLGQILRIAFQGYELIEPQRDEAGFRFTR